jgi:DNA repair exonuclease SbcCD ATPase subunit
MDLQSIALATWPCRREIGARGYCRRARGQVALPAGGGSLERMRSLLVAALLLVGAPACRSSYYGVMEKFGVHKREILVDRVEEGREAQAKAKAEFQSALKSFQSTTGFRGGKLEELYEELNDHYEDCDQRVTEVKERIEAIEQVAGDLFKEWKGEIGQISDPKLRSQSERTLADTRSAYAQLLAAMQKAAKKMDPVLVTLKDHVLYLKHNLNAQAIASLKGNLATIETDVAGLVREMENAIAEADSFVKSMSG